MTTARRRRASSRSISRPRTPARSDEERKRDDGDGAAGACASEIRSRPLQRPLEILQGEDLARAGRRDVRRGVKSESYSRSQDLSLIYSRFDVAYDDGEAETRVEERLIRSLDGGGRGSRSPSPRGGGRGRLREGEKIEAPYRGPIRYYPGRIARDRGDGTFDVDCAHAASFCLHTRGRRVPRGRV